MAVHDQMRAWIHWFRWSLLNHSQPPQHLLKAVTAHDHMCPHMHWFTSRTFWAFILNCDLINNNLTVIKLRTCTLNALCMIYIKYYIVKVFIVECNFSIKYKNHPFSDTCSYELFFFILMWISHSSILSRHFRYTLYSIGGIWLNMNSMAHWHNDKWQGETEVAYVKNNLSWCQHKTHMDCSKKERLYKNSNTSVPSCIIKIENQTPKLHAFILTYSANSRLLMPRTVWNMCTDYLLKALF